MQGVIFHLFFCESPQEYGLSLSFLLIVFHHYVTNASEFSLPAMAHISSNTVEIHNKNIIVLCTCNFFFCYLLTFLKYYRASWSQTAAAATLRWCRVFAKRHISVSKLWDAYVYSFVYYTYLHLKCINFALEKAMKIGLESFNGFFSLYLWFMKGIFILLKNLIDVVVLQKCKIFSKITVNLFEGKGWGFFGCFWVFFC